jgi:thiamine monophosphate synthase
MSGQDAPRVVLRGPQDKKVPRSAEERRAIVDAHLPALMLVTDWSMLRGRSAIEVVTASVAVGASMVQLRDQWPLPMASAEQRAAWQKQPWDIQLDTDALIQLRQVVAAFDARRAIDRSALVWTHGGADAAAAGARGAEAVSGDCGVHVPERPLAGFSLPPRVATIRRDYGEFLLISRSVHSVEAALQAERDSADMLVLGTVFPSSSHPSSATIGLDGVRAVCEAVSIPVIGIGGITAANAGDVIRAGASGVAVISAIFGAPDPRAAAAALRAAIDAAWAER